MLQINKRLNVLLFFLLIIIIIFFFNNFIYIYINIKYYNNKNKQYCY